MDDAVEVRISAAQLEQIQALANRCAYLEPGTWARMVDRKAWNAGLGEILGAERLQALWEQGSRFRFVVGDD